MVRGEQVNPRICLLMLIACLYFINGIAFGSTGVEWTKSYGGIGDEVLHASLYTSDNCFLLVGESDSFTDNHYDVYIAKINQNGVLLWNTTYGGEGLTEDDCAYAVIEISDGYLITGKTISLDGIGDDVLLLKIDKNGNKLWVQHFGGNAWDWGEDLLQTNDNSFLIAGTTQSFYGSPYEIYLIKCDSNGNRIWRKTYSYSDNQYTSSIISVSGNYFIVGTTKETTGVTSDIFLLKIDAEGKEVWYKQYGGSEKETAANIIQSGNHFIITGTTNSYGNGRNDVYVIKVDLNGNIIWEKTVGSPSDESSQHVQVISGTIIITGNTFKETGNSLDPYLITLDGNGKLSFNQTYGTKTYEKAISTHVVGSDTYYLTGYQGSNNHNFMITKISLSTFSLNINTQVGEVYGAGLYYLGASPVIGLTEETVNEGSRIRYLFNGWSSTTNGGYNGLENPVQLSIQNNIIQTANWQKQYYVEISTEGEGETNGVSGWYDEGILVTIESTANGENELLQWTGQGPGSYTGTASTAKIQVNGPVYETAEFGIHPVWDVIIESEYGIVYGSGSYREGDEVNIELTQDKIQLSSTERVVFTGWSNPTEEGHTGAQLEATFIVSEDTTQVATWKTQYYVEFENPKHGTAPQSGWFDAGANIPLSSSPNPEYQFDHWEITTNGQTTTIEKEERLLVNSGVKVVAVITLIPKPNYTLIAIIGSVIASPFVVKSWITIESNLKRRDLAKKEYNDSRGTIHKKMLESALPNLKKKITQLSQLIENLGKEKRSLESKQIAEIEKKASTYIFENKFTQIPGIGKKLQSRIRSQVFDGTLNSLLRSSWVEGIGATKSAEISWWVQQQQRQLPTFIRNGFPGKKEVEQRYRSDINQVERKIFAG